MNKRTDGEVQAYVDGYNACYDRFVEILMQRGSVTKAIEKMDMFKEATNSVLLTENVGMCQQNVGEISEQTDGDLISRQSVKDLIRGLTKWGVRSQDGKFENVGLLYDDVMFGIDRLPSAEKTTLSEEKTTITDGDLISRQSVITMLNKIENAVEDGDGFQFNEWVKYAKDIPSAEKTDGDLIAEIDKLPRIKVGNSNSPTVKYCIDEVLLYELLEHYNSEKTGSILEDIKAEIDDLETFYDNDRFSSNGEPMYKKYEVLEIIDKHISGKEEE